MAVRVEVDSEQRLARRIYFGVVTGEELLSSVHAYGLNSEFDPTFDEVMDFREVKNLDVMVEDIHRCAHIPVPFAPTSKRIILAPQSLIYGLARMYQIIGAEVHPNVYVVRSVEEATRILGRRPAA